MPRFQISVECWAGQENGQTGKRGPAKKSARACQLVGASCPGLRSGRVRGDGGRPGQVESERQHDHEQAGRGHQRKGRGRDAGGIPDRAADDGAEGGAGVGDGEQGRAQAVDVAGNTANASSNYTVSGECYLNLACDGIPDAYKLAAYDALGDTAARGL